MELYMMKATEKGASKVCGMQSEGIVLKLW